MATDLSSRRCRPCKGDEPPVKGAAIEKLRRQLAKGWLMVREHHLEKDFAFKDFKDALAFVVKVGELAETEGHHPDIYLTWAKVRLTIWTHRIDALTENDFILAAKVDLLAPRAAPA